MGRLSTREAVETAVGKAADDAVLSYVTSIVEDDDFEWGPDCEEAAEIFGPMLASCRDPPRSRAAASAPRWAQTDSAVLPPARPPARRRSTPAALPTTRLRTRPAASYAVCFSSPTTHPHRTAPTTTAATTVATPMAAAFER